MVRFSCAPDAEAWNYMYRFKAPGTGPKKGASCAGRFEANRNDRTSVSEAELEKEQTSGEEDGT